MTRSEHLQWCKERALKYLEEGDITGAFSSMMSDIRKHSDTDSHYGIQIGMMLMMAGKLSSIGAMEKFINGFN